METVRVGVVGVGGMGAFHARTLAAMAHVQLEAIADPLVETARRLGGELGCDALSTPAELMARTDLDGVVIASPDETHADLAIAALERGLWVLCEKPLATDLADARRVIDAELALGSRRIQLGFMREYDPTHVRLVAELPQIGAVDVVRAVHRNCSPRRRPVRQIVGQSMVHDFHSVRFITGQTIASVHAVGSGPGDDWFRHILAVCELRSGAHAIVEFDDAGFAYEVGFEVLGQHGDLVTATSDLVERRRNGGIETFLGDDWFARFADAYRIQDAAWIASIRRGEAAGPSSWDGYVAQSVVDATLRSLASGTTEQVGNAPVPPLYATT